MYSEDFVKVKKSTIDGKGIFAGKDFKTDEIIMVISGEVISEEECIRREEEEGNVYIFWNDSSYIDVVNTDKIKYINHNCDYNCYVEANDDCSLLLMAERDIKKGEELTIDYGYDEIYDLCNCSECTNKNSH